MRRIARFLTLLLLGLAGLAVVGYLALVGIGNPYDLRQASDALAMALRMSPAEQRERMRSMRRLVSEFNVYRWAGRMLVDAAELRRREQLSGRFSGAPLEVLR